MNSVVMTREMEAAEWLAREVATEEWQSSGCFGDKLMLCLF